MFNLRTLFTREAIVRQLQQLPILKTPVMDTIFTDRQQKTSPIVGIEDILSVVRAMPVVRRDSASIPATSQSRNYQFIEPLPVNAHVFATAADLNNLQVLDPAGKDMWAREKNDFLRRACRMTTEGIAAVSLSGTITWPCQLQTGGFENYTVAYGTPLSVVPTVLWSAAGVKVADVFDLFQTMEEALQDEGYGSTVEVWAGKTAYNLLFKIAEAVTSTAKIRVEITDQGINIGGYLVKRRSERYRNPQTGVMTPTIADKEIKMIAMDAGHKLIYCALDDLDANLQPLPFFSKPIKSEDPSGWKIVGESKPLPVANPKGICGATVSN